MKITGIVAKNVKGRSFKYKLGAVNMITGHPFSGKTAVRDALVFALCGHLPWLGKTPRATSEIASDSPMMVEIDTDGGSFARSLVIKGDKVSLLDCDGMPETPSVLMNMSEFFGLGPTDRTNYIFSRISIPEDKFSPHSLIDTIYLSEIDKSSKVERDVLDELVAEIKDHADGYDAAKDNGVKMLIQTWLESRIKETKEKLKEHKSALKRYAGASQTTVELTVKHGEANSRSKSNIEKDIQACRDELSKLNEELGRLRSEQSAAYQTMRRKSELEKIIQTTIPDTSVARARYAELKALTELLNNSVAPEKRKAVEAIQSKINAINLALRDANTIHRSPGTLFQELNSKITVSRANFSNLTRTKVQRTTEHKEMLLKGDYCKSCQERLTEKFNQSMTSVDSELKAAMDLADNYSKEYETSVTKTLNEAAQIIQSKTAELNEANKVLEAAQKELSDAEAETQKSINNLREMQRLEQEIKTAERAGELVNNARTELSKIGEVPNHQQAINDLQASISAKQYQAKTFDMELQELGAQEEAEARRAQTAGEKLQAEAKVKVVDLALDKMLEFQQKLITDTVGALMKTANLFIKDIPVPKDLPFTDLGEIAFRDGIIGLVRGRHFISSGAMCGTEQALVFSGVAVALAADAPFKIVLLDEMTRLNEPSRVLATAVIERMKKLCADGVIEQFCGIDITSEPYNSIPEVNHITV